MGLEAGDHMDGDSMSRCSASQRLRCAPLHCLLWLCSTGHNISTCHACVSPGRAMMRAPCTKRWKYSICCLRHCTNWWLKSYCSPRCYLERWTKTQRFYPCTCNYQTSWTHQICWKPPWGCHRGLPTRMPRPSSVSRWRPAAVWSLLPPLAWILWAFPADMEEILQTASQLTARYILSRAVWWESACSPICSLHGPHRACTACLRSWLLASVPNVLHCTHYEDRLGGTCSSTKPACWTFRTANRTLCRDADLQWSEFVNAGTIGQGKPADLGCVRGDQLPPVCCAGLDHGIAFCLHALQHRIVTPVSCVHETSNALAKVHLRVSRQSRESHQRWASSND